MSCPLCGSGDLEIVFAHLDNSRSNQIFGPKNFVFTEQLLGVLDLAKARQRAAELRAIAEAAKQERMRQWAEGVLADAERRKRETAEAAFQVHNNLHKGKLGILVLSPEEGLGVKDTDKRAKHADKIELFKRFSD